MRRDGQAVLQLPLSVSELWQKMGGEKAEEEGGKRREEKKRKVGGFLFVLFHRRTTESCLDGTHPSV